MSLFLSVYVSVFFCACMCVSSEGSHPPCPCKEVLLLLWLVDYCTRSFSQLGYCTDWFLLWVNWFVGGNAAPGGTELAHSLTHTELLTRLLTRLVNSNILIVFPE